MRLRWLRRKPELCAVTKIAINERGIKVTQEVTVKAKRMSNLTLKEDTQGPFMRKEALAY